MSFVEAAYSAVAKYSLFVNVVLFLYATYFFWRKMHLQRSISAITKLSADYFNFTGADVKFRCIPIEKKDHFILLIQSKPLKRFRFSNILEQNLILHIQNKTGYIVDQIYWRFPVEIRKDVIVPEGHGDERVDDNYFEGKENSHHDDNAADWESSAANSSEYVVTELTWEEFGGN
jgi:hypothetical protein